MSNGSDDAAQPGRGAARARALPLLRPVEIIRVPGPSGLVTLLRDPEKIAVRNVEIEPPLDGALVLMNGTRTAAEIARMMGPRGSSIEDIQALVRTLEENAMLDGPTFAARKRALVAAFARARVRPAGFAGGAYHADPVELGRFIDESFAEEELRRRPSPAGGAVRGLVAPHMDLWRAFGGYATSYATLEQRLPEDLDLIVVLGTCHAGMRSPFALTAKGFETPFGVMPADHELALRLADRARFDVFADEYKHRGEHSIEFQVVYLAHVLGRRTGSVPILPILCGLGRSQVMRTDPARDAEAESLVSALVEEVSGRSVLVVAGADLAHVGPRFGDPRALVGAERARLEARDRTSLDALVARDAAGFFAHVTEDLDERRVCGTGPLYTLLRALEGEGPLESEVLSYTQHVDPDEGSIVSHASAVFCEPERG